MSIKDVLKDAEERMKSTLAVLEEDLKAMRTGRASGALVEKLLVDYYGVRRRCSNWRASACRSRR